MRKMVVLPEEVYEALISTSKKTNADPFDNQIQEGNEKIAKLFADNKMPSDTKNLLYDQELKRVKNLKNLKPEAQIERNLNPVENVPEPQVLQEQTDATQNSPSLSPSHVEETLAAAPQEPQRNERKKQMRTAKPSTQLERKAAEITQKLLVHQDRLPIDTQGQIKRENGSSIKGSHLFKSVKYALEGNLSNKKPNGYAQLMKSIRQHEDLQSLLNLTPVEGDGRFKPALWKKF